MASDSHNDESLFNAARDLTDPARRRAFLDEACSGDQALRARVERLLSAAEDTDAFFASCTPALEAAAAAINPSPISPSPGISPLADEAPGSRIGPYKLLQRIGEGGCGIVYMAEQVQPMRRRVAIKVIKLGMDTKSVIARFEAERQALALMNHPNIARVLDAGATDTGRPYFVMELVTGVKLTEYCDQNQVELGQRLELFIQICHAIQHAHQKGIIHRDIKPSNILVTMHDGVPVPKVIDFGIAKATEERLTDKTIFTAYAQLIGTPAYMSPEQAELSGLDLDTRSDIYSLGVLLYELLTGRTPFDTKELLKSGVDELRRAVRERDPSTPSAMLRSLSGEELAKTARQCHLEPPRLLSRMRGDLDWIVMKALEKDRTRRYQTANGLAMDIRRHLDNEPVVARPPSRWYKMRKLVRRNRMVFLAGAAVAAALLAGTVTSTTLYLRELDDRRKTLAAQREAETARREAAQRHDAELLGKAAQAYSMLAQNKFVEADQLVSEIQFDKPSSDAAHLLRSLGFWHAMSHRWKEADARLAPLVKLNQFDKPDVVTIDYLALAPVLIEAGDLNAYERFRQEAITRFASATNSTPDRIIRFTLLLPANEQVLQDLLPQVEAVEKTLPGDLVASNNQTTEESWRSMALALFDYRRGDYAKAVEWSRRCLMCREDVPPRNAAVNAILAGCYWQMNQTDAALAALNQSQEILKGDIKPGPGAKMGPNRFWFDWAFARVLFREGEERFSQADQSIAQLAVLTPSLETAAMFRIMGEWHALRHEWPLAADRYRALVKVDQQDDWSLSILDCFACGVTLAESGDRAGYERFRQDIPARFKGTDNKAIAERAVKICVLAPADEKILTALTPLAETVAHPSANDLGICTARGLLEYRRGNYAKAVDWCRRSLASTNNIPPPAPTARVVLAMSLHGLGQDQGARTELQDAEKIVEDKFKTSFAPDSWQDWVYAQVLLREAAALLNAVEPGASKH